MNLKFVVRWSILLSLFTVCAIGMALIIAFIVFGLNDPYWHGSAVAMIFTFVVCLGIPALINLFYWSLTPDKPNS